ncbi:MAG: preprotein translocase subunit SecE [Bacilli bacterium]|nr:preprotein translocase subunit SecE [Bacilli bacterium]
MAKKQVKRNNNNQKKVPVQKENNTKSNPTSKENLITRIIIFFKGVRSEIKKVHWLDRKSMVKYSVATICFIVFCALFFYVIMNLFALVQELLG